MPDWRMDELFLDSEKYVYFIEDEITHKLFSKKMDEEWTSNPLDAMSFKSDMKARTFAVSAKIADIHKCTWIITEYEIIKLNR